MPTLFLTSAGFTNEILAQTFLAELGKTPASARALVLGLARNSAQRGYIEASKKELEWLGIGSVTLVNIRGQRETDAFLATQEKNPQKFDIIYVCGGNTFRILQRLRDSRLDKYIINQVNAGAIYVGVSAGSIVVGPDIEIAGWGSEGDKNDIDLTDLTGFGLTNVRVFPHFREHLRKEVDVYRKKLSENKSENKVVELTDSQALFVKGEQNRIIGN